MAQRKGNAKKQWPRGRRKPLLVPSNSISLAHMSSLVESHQALIALFPRSLSSRNLSISTNVATIVGAMGSGNNSENAEREGESPSPASPGRTTSSLRPSFSKSQSSSADASCRHQSLQSLSKFHHLSAASQRDFFCHFFFFHSSS